MRAFYNEIEPYAAAWLQNLSSAGLIARGRVETRSVVDLTPDDLRGYRQAHFFAGIGVWSHALRLAGWPDDVPIWTGSCPCQPFSSAGAQRGFSDERHLWPAWFELIRACRPAVVVGEQVSSKGGLAWFDAVQSDLEGAGYTCRAIDSCAAGVGAPHIRQRLYFVALAPSARAWRVHLSRRRLRAGLPDAGRDGEARDIRLVDSALVRERPHDGVERASRELPREARGRGLPGGGLGGAPIARRDGSHVGVPGPHGEARGALADSERSRSGAWGSSGADGRAPLQPDRHSTARGVGDANLDGVGQHARELPRDEAEHDERSAFGDHALEHPGAARRAVGESSGRGCAPGSLRDRSSGDEGRTGSATANAGAARGPVNGFWSDAEWVWCRDGKYRPVEPGSFPLAAGAPARVGRLRAYGNSIVAPLAAVFLEAVIDCITES